MTVPTVSKQLQTRCTPKSYSDLAAIIPSLSTFAAYDVQVVISPKRAPAGSKETSKKTRVVVSLYHSDYLPKELQVTSPTVFETDNDAAFRSALIVQVVFIGPAAVDARLQYGASAPKRLRDGDASYEKLSFEEQAQVVNRLYHWVSRQVKEVAEVSLPWEPLNEELTDGDIGMLQLLAKAAKEKETKIRASDVAMAAACTI
ncbi:hypothetical protein BCR44DRAFT_40327, partial [Catenaria anguillulae PL171]